MNDRAPVTIAIVGTGTGDGGGEAPTPSGTIAVTPGGQPDLRVLVIAPMVAILIRFLHLFLVTMTGLVTAGAVTDVFTLDLRQMAIAALSAAVVGLAKDLVTVFGRLEGKYPLATGSI